MDDRRPGTENEARHVPVLLTEVMSFIIQPGTKTVLDATIGAGGHAEAILKAMDGVKLIGLDRDPCAVSISKGRLAPYKGRVEILHSHFLRLDAALDSCGVEKVDFILMDLGVSSMQLDTPERGFSLAKDGPLDMRMDPSSPSTAASIVNEAGHERLVSIFRKYGEEKNAARIARAIVEERGKSPITTTGRLADIVAKASSSKGQRRIHPATRVFQAIRIAVNNELDIIAPAIQKGVERLNNGGRIAVISFHSLEDRIVKKEFADLEGRCQCPKNIPVCVCGRYALVKTLTRKPVRPAAGEMEANRRARSAKLRVAEKVAA